MDERARPPGLPQPPPYEPRPPGARGGGGLHPLDVGLALAAGWSLYRFRWPALVGVVLVVLAPTYALNAIWYIAYGAAFEDWVIDLPESPAELADLPPLPTEALVTLLGVGVATSLAGVIATAAAVNLVAWTYGGGSPTAGAALRSALRRWASLIGATLLAALIVLGIVALGTALVLLLIAGTGFAGGPTVFVALVLAVATVAAVIFVAVRWALIVHAIMLEGQSAVAGLGRSWQLVAGSTWRVLGYLVLVLLLMSIVGILGGVVQAVVFGLGVDATGQPPGFDSVRAIGQMIIEAGVTVLVTPFWAAVLTLLYYDLRWRRGEPLHPPPD